MLRFPVPGDGPLGPRTGTTGTVSAPGPWWRTVAREQALLGPSATAEPTTRLRQGGEAEAEPDALPGLTEREREILAPAGEGLTDRQLGQRLHLAEGPGTARPRSGDDEPADGVPRRR